jgi:hypothetical protein
MSDSSEEEEQVIHDKQNQEFNPEVTHIPGRNNIGADTLIATRKVFRIMNHIILETLP